MNIKYELDIAVKRVEELTKRLNALKVGVEHTKEELIKWMSRADTLKEVAGDESNIDTL